MCIWRMLLRSLLTLTEPWNGHYLRPHGCRRNQVLERYRTRMNRLYSMAIYDPLPLDGEGAFAPKRVLHTVLYKHTHLPIMDTLEAECTHCRLNIPARIFH